MARQPLQTMHAVARLWRLMDDVSLAPTDDDVYSVGLQTIRNSIGVERAAILLLQDGVMRFVAHSGLSDAYRAAVEGHSPWDPNQQKFSPVLVADVLDDPDLQGFEDVFEAENIRALAFIPLYYEDRLLGKFMLYYPDRHEFDEREIAVARAIASHVSFALEHRRVEAELERRLDEERKARARLRESEHRLRIALDAAKMGAWEWDMAQNSVVWSPELQRLHGLEPGTFGGDFAAFKSDIHPDDLEGALQTISAFLESGEEVYENRYRIVCPSGEIKWIEACGRYVFDDEGKPQKLIGVCGDITERRRNDERREFIAEATALLTSSLDPLELVRTLTRLTVPWLADWCVLNLGIPGGEIETVEVAHADPSQVSEAWRLAEQYPPRRDGSRNAAYVIDSGESVLIERVGTDTLSSVHADPERLAAIQTLELHSAMTVPLRARGEILGALTLATAESRREYTRDDLVFAEELAARAALALVNARLYEATRRAVAVREEVLAIVSHDLRNPINTIAAACAIHGLPVEEHKKARAIESIKRATQQMDHLIQDLLDVSRIEAGKLIVEPEDLDVTARLEESREMFVALADEKGVSLISEVPAGLRVWADPGSLQQALSNLIGNALKFVDRGGHVTISARDAGDAIEFSVRDDGIGIAPEQLPHLFDRFWQAREAARGGTGLGLAIVKGIIDAHGGSITASSVQGEGTTFTFTIPHRT